MTQSNQPTRDAERTRRELLDAALTRFARDGYTGTRVRDIASDVGVDAALINRYFVSKAGLFDACLAKSGKLVVELGQGIANLYDARDRVIKNMSHTTLKQEVFNALLLLLRPTTNQRTEQVRITILRGFGESLAGLSGWPAETPPQNDRLLRAELFIAISLGVTTLRLSGLEPLSSIGTNELRQHLDKILLLTLNLPNNDTNSAPSEP